MEFTAIFYGELMPEGALHDIIYCMRCILLLCGLGIVNDITK